MKFDTSTIGKVMEWDELNLLAIQEPPAHGTKLDNTWVEQVKWDLREMHYELITSRYNYIIIDEQHFGPKQAFMI